MAERIRITETDLRYFMRDRRYWQAGHPERQGYVAWVTDGFRTLFGSSDGAGSGAVTTDALTDPDQSPARRFPDCSQTVRAG